MTTNAKIVLELTGAETIRLAARHRRPLLTSTSPFAPASSWLLSAAAAVGSRPCSISPAASTSRASDQSKVNDTELALLNRRQLTAIRRQQIGFVFQALNLLPTLTAENVSLPLELNGMAPAAAQWLRGVTARGRGRSLRRQLPRPTLGRRAPEGSPVARARWSPKSTVADEPTGALDEATADADVDASHQTSGSTQEPAAGFL
ncbi:MAG: hypothetical protein R2706_10535 [Acidimicrobiales bacterium]